MLRARIANEVETLLREGLAPAKKMVADLVDIELAFVNTNHPDFIGAAGAIAGKPFLLRPLSIVLFSFG